MRPISRLKKLILLTFLLTLIITGGVPGLVSAQQQPPPQAPPAVLSAGGIGSAGRPSCPLSRSLAGADPGRRNVSGSDSRRSEIRGRAPLSERGRSGSRHRRGPSSWDPSVQALIPFPSVLEMMASDMNWTVSVRECVPGTATGCNGRGAADEANGKRLRVLAERRPDCGGCGPYVTIMPMNPAIVCVPVYNPGVVFAPPRPGFVVGGGNRFGFGVSLGSASGPGVGDIAVCLGSARVFVTGSLWGRTWSNRGYYAQPYHGVQRWNGPRAPEHHKLIRRSESERL